MSARTIGLGTPTALSMKLLKAFKIEKVDEHFPSDLTSLDWYCALVGSLAYQAKIEMLHLHVALQKLCLQTTFLLNIFIMYHIKMRKQWEFNYFAL